MNHQPSKAEPKLTIFADAQCPLCVMEMKHLSAKDIQNCISIEDINAPDFTERFPHIDVEEASKVLHAQTENGETLLGLDVSHKAWSMVGRSWMFGFLRWGPVRPIADFFYRVFARNRYFISKVLTGKSRVDD